MKGGTFRRIADGFKRLVGRPVTSHYKDPVLRDPRDRQKKRGSGSGGLNKGLQSTALLRPASAPGTIGYHDKLVRHFGRRMAEGYRIAIQRGHMNCLPSEQDFSEHPPWAFLK
jgi:hypothetical protein